MSSIPGFTTVRGTDVRALHDRLTHLRGEETPTAREDRLRAVAAERTAVAAERGKEEALHASNLAAFRDEDIERTKQQQKVTKLMAKIRKSTDDLITALPEKHGGRGEIGNLRKNYNKATKTLGKFIKHYANSKPDINPEWKNLPVARKRALTYFHQNLASNLANHRDISRLNTAKKAAEQVAQESGVEDFRSLLTPDQQERLDNWMVHLDTPPPPPQPSNAVPVARVVGSSKQGGRKTRKRRRRRKRKTRKHRKKKRTRRRKPKKRHRRTRRR